MLKQIVPMALYMIGVMYSICFGGEYFFPEPNTDYRFNHPTVPYVYPGRLYDWDGTELFIKFEYRFGASRHLTNVFNIFVVMAIFNIVNVSLKLIFHFRLESLTTN